MDLVAFKLFYYILRAESYCDEIGPHILFDYILITNICALIITY